MKRIFKYFARVLVILISLVLLYALVAALGSLIPVNKERDGSKGETEAFIRTNGVHTTIILPAKNNVIDWYTVVDPGLTKQKNKAYNYVSFGWGDLEFYKNTPEWSDLTIPIAFQAMFLKSPGALHIRFYEDASEDEDTFSILLTEEQHEKLTLYIRNSFNYDANGDTQPVPDLHYGENDVFYHARRHMNLFYTCNTWTNNALKRSNLRACLWTPFDRGIFFQYR